MCEINAQGYYDNGGFVRKMIFVIIFDSEINVITVYLYRIFSGAQKMDDYYLNGYGKVVLSNFDYN